MKKKLKKRLPTIILLIILVIGLSLLLYPSVSNYINSIHQTQSVANYNEALSMINDNEFDGLKEDVKKYNQALRLNRQDFINGEPIGKNYKSLLNVNGGMIGYISIDKIGVQLPIYHGTSEAVLSNGVGHLEGSSLPLGGTGTHCVLTGHRGVPASELFSNLVALFIALPILLLFILIVAVRYAVSAYKRKRIEKLAK